MDGHENGTFSGGSLSAPPSLNSSSENWIRLGPGCESHGVANNVLDGNICYRWVVSILGSICGPRTPVRPGCSRGESDCQCWPSVGANGLTREWHIFGWKCPPTIAPPPRFEKLDQVFTGFLFGLRTMSRKGYWFVGTTLVPLPILFERSSSNSSSTALREYNHHDDGNRPFAGYTHQ